MKSLLLLLVLGSFVLYSAEKNKRTIATQVKQQKVAAAQPMTNQEAVFSKQPEKKS